LEAEAMMEWFLLLMGSAAVKAIIIAVMVLIAHKWSKGEYDKNIKSLTRLGKEYGVVTLALIVVWWILTPSGMPDDAVAVWILSQLGLVPYVLLLGGLSAYLVWRLRVTIVIYKKK
jgi:hypothetical protein